MIMANDHGISVELAVPHLFGQKTSSLLSSPTFELLKEGSFHLLKNDRLLFGAACMEVEKLPQETSARLYYTLLNCLGEYQLLRIWNYVPKINAIGPQLENYQSFCVGRSEQFKSFELDMPSASAVGTKDNKMVVYFIATKTPVKHLENPEQIPAYKYPRQYGPRAPSFSRASYIEQEEEIFVYVSGTASIKGHQSVNIGNLGLQLDTTLDNIRIMKDQIFSNSETDPGSRLLSETTIYLRDRSQLPEILNLLKPRNINEQTLRIVEADICRADLAIEIETQQGLVTNLRS